MSGLKWCKGCCKEKSLEDFYLDGNGGRKSQCKSCYGEYSRQYKRGRRRQDTPGYFFDAEPIRQAIKDRAIREGVSVATVCKELLKRPEYHIMYRKERFRWDAVDTLCTRLGHHPTEIYGQEWVG